MGNYSSALVPGKPVSFKRVSFWSPVLSSADVCHEEGMNVHALACDGCALTSFFLCFTERHRGVWVNCDGGADSAEVTVRAADSGKYTVHCTLYNSHHHLQRAHEEAVLNTVHSLFVCLPTCWLSIIYLLYDLTKVFFFLTFSWHISNLRVSVSKSKMSLHLCHTLKESLVCPCLVCPWDKFNFTHRHF